jgi:signal transduction histidine kinase
MTETARLREQTILLVSDDAELCAAARREFEVREEGLRVTSVGSVDAAQKVVAGAAPAVILLEETSFESQPEGSDEPVLGLNSVVSALAVYAPVVVIGQERQEAEVAALVAAGAADFVPRSKVSLPVALGLVERRLRKNQQIAGGAQEEMTENGTVRERFGEVLRHELNNPLTGILGNAELLLAELRRKNDGRMPQGGQQRLETIAALAVRLRETVRRLSQEWETGQNTAP